MVRILKLRKREQRIIAKNIARWKIEQADREFRKAVEENKVA